MTTSRKTAAPAAFAQQQCQCHHTQHIDDRCGRQHGLAHAALKQAALLEGVEHERERGRRQGDRHQAGGDQRQAQQQIRDKENTRQRQREGPDTDRHAGLPGLAQTIRIHLEPRHEHQAEHAQVGEEFEPAERGQLATQPGSEQDAAGDFQNRRGDVQLEREHGR